jgi:Zn-finger nucleic acid-binding protein
MSWRCPSCGLHDADPAQTYRGAQCTRCHTPLVLDAGVSATLEFECPWCRRAVDASANRCRHCARKFGVPRCESCGGAIDPSAEFCAHCNVPIVHRGEPRALAVTCPVCTVPLGEQVVGQGIVLACHVCQGVFLTHELLDHWTADRARNAPDDLPEVPHVIADGSIRYRRCARCAGYMNRVNFGPGSGIILDVCKSDGVWFDGGELKSAVAFARSGRLDEARARRAREKEALEGQRRRDGRLSDPGIDRLGIREGSLGDTGNWLSALLHGLFGL